ncbi:MAG: transposase [Thermodesulfobacteriota bacterium]|nr:transposase [Thermodesulfobacteriota bacterium]
MARPLRIEYEGAFYHVTARGNERRRIYYSKADYEKFKAYLEETQKKYGYLLHGYVLLTNHYHLLIETPMANLSKVMHYINGSYTNYINIKERRSGHLFQGRYKAILIDRDEYLLELSRYLHLNPVRAKIAERPEDYPYSSYRAYIEKNKKDIVYRDLILGMMSKTKNNAINKYKNFVGGAIEVDLENPLKNVYGGMILGGTRFIKEALSIFKEEDLNKEDIAHRRALRAAYRFEEIIESICMSLDIPQQDLLSRKNKEQRNIAIYLLKKYTGLTNRQIGQQLGNISYSAVAKVYQRFSEELRKDKALKKKVEGIISNLSLVKG